MRSHVGRGLGVNPQVPFPLLPATVCRRSQRGRRALGSVPFQVPPRSAPIVVTAGLEWSRGAAGGPDRLVVRMVRGLLGCAVPRCRTPSRCLSRHCHRHHKLQAFWGVRLDPNRRGITWGVWGTPYQGGQGGDWAPPGARSLPLVGSRRVTRGGCGFRCAALALPTLILRLCRGRVDAGFRGGRNRLSAGRARVLVENLPAVGHRVVPPTALRGHRRLLPATR